MKNHSRITKTINADWLFSYSPETELDETNPPDAWTAVALPHTWSVYETTGRIHPFIHDAAEEDDDFWWKGWGWYKKEFVVDDVHADKKVFGEFDGVQKYCRVYLNGSFVADHKGGFTSFHVDLSDSLKFGEANTLTVAVSNLRRDPLRIPPMDAGNWDVYGGIYRDVRLVLTDKLHIPFQGDHRREGGTFVTTPQVSASEATIDVLTYVQNDHETVKRCVIRHAIVDPSGDTIQTLESSLEVQSGELAKHECLSDPVSNPKLWSPDSPALYRVVTEIFLDGRVIDVRESPLGFRWFHWDYDRKTFYLNGEPLNLVGTNRHQEYPWLGDAMPKWLHEVDMDDIKFNLNHNFMRTCHYPQDPFIYDYCDRNGILICEEVPNIKNCDFDDEIQKHNVIEMIRRDRNHPCVVMWSMGNETNHAADGDWARAEDTNRIIHFRKCLGRGENEPHNSSQIDMENLLRCAIRGWYDVDDIQQEAGNDYAPENGQRASTEEFQHQMARVANGSIRHRIDWPNVITWIYADHGADREYGNCPLKHVNPKGWVDAYRVPKHIYHLWRANYSKEPMIHIHGQCWREKYLGQRKDIIVDSNCDSVELFVNGESLGTKTFDKTNFHTNAFADVSVVKGELKAVGTKGNETIQAIVSMAGSAAKLTLTSSHERITADRAGVAILTANVVDGDERNVIGASPDLFWEVDGPATLIGPDHYVDNHGKDGAMAGMMYFDTPIANLIRSGGQPGTVKVTVSSPGLESASVAIVCVQPENEAVDGLHEPPAIDSPVPPDYSTYENQRVKQRKAKIEIIQQDLDFGTASRSEYYRMIDEFIVKHNPDVDSEICKYRQMVEELAETTLKNGGTLIADDYCFITGKF